MRPSWYPQGNFKRMDVCIHSSRAIESVCERAVKYYSLLPHQITSSLISQIKPTKGLQRMRTFPSHTCIPSARTPTTEKFFRMDTVILFYSYSSGKRIYLQAFTDPNERVLYALQHSDLHCNFDEGIYEPDDVNTFMITFLLYKDVFSSVLPLHVWLCS
jgi:hypothetical protein